MKSSNIQKADFGIEIDFEKGSESPSTAQDETKMNASFSIVPEKIEELLTHEVIDNQSTMILKVKKPDYLGESQWDFRHGTKPLSVKIVDSEWLKNFHDRKYDIRPGDSLRAVVVTKVSYGYDNEVVATHYEISEVKEIIRFTPPQQIPLLPP
ncbi:hypothetical protein FBQ87_12195 [Sphingobacteriales bacterium CHB3]|nr:hypothetical protein [Sphingobacteriales bacterium CHB3]